MSIFTINFPSPDPVASSNRCWTDSFTGLLLINLIASRVGLFRVPWILSMGCSIAIAGIVVLRSLIVLPKNWPFLLVNSKVPALIEALKSNFSTTGHPVPYSIKVFFPVVVTINEPLLGSGRLFASTNGKSAVEPLIATKVFSRLPSRSEVSNQWRLSALIVFG